MDNKYFIDNVAQLLSDKTGQNVSEAEEFLRELIKLFNEGITKDNYVKIRGIGIFKLVLVKERESVHVNTGERIVIPSHNKLSFTPEEKLKDIINKPFALFEAIETQEDDNGLLNITSSDEEIEKEDIEELLLPPPPPIEEKPLPPPPPIEEKPLPPPPPVEEKPLPPPPQPKEENSLHQASPVPLAQKKSNQNTKEPKKPKHSSTTILLWVLFMLLFLFLASAIYYFFFYNRWDTFDPKLTTRILGNELSLPGDTILSDSILNDNQSSKDTLALVQSETGNTDTIPKITPPSTPAAATSTRRQEPATRPTTTPSATTSPQTTASSTSNNVLARVSMQPGQRLTLIAEEYYGNKVFWVYIYEYNKANIGSNPNLVRTGMEILVPAKALYGIDAQSAASIEKATDIQRQIMEGTY